MPKILILESDRQLGRNFIEYFRQQGHEAQSHVDPQAAIINADSTRPDVVIVDSMLASRSGIEFLYEMRSYPEWQNIPAIVLGNYGAEEVEGFANTFELLDVKAYFYKPSSSLKQILDQVESLLQPQVA
jgi:DNA-binding response OmpR family regulator